MKSNISSNEPGRAAGNSDFSVSEPGRTAGNPGHGSDKPDRRGGKAVKKEKTGRRIAAHDFKNALRQAAAPMLLGLIAFLVLFPVSTAAVPDFSIFNVDYTHQQLKFRFCAQEVLPVVQAAVLIFGAATGIRLFSFLSDRSRTSFYLSLGLKRRKLFLIRFAAGLLAEVIGIGLPVAVSAVVNDTALGIYEGMVSYAVCMAAGMILEAAVMMLIAAAACCIAGTFSEAAVLTVTLAAAPTAVLSFAGELAKTFLWGNTRGETTYAMENVAPDLVEKFSFLNPLTFFYSDMETYYSYSREMASPDPEPADVRALVLWAAAAAAATALVCLLFCRRKSENAGISGLSRFYALFVPLIWPLAVFSAVLGALRDVSRPLAACAAFFCFALFYAVIVSAAGRNMSLRKKCGYAACLICAAGTAVLITSCGMFGYASRVPQPEEVASVSVSYAGQPALLPTAAGASSSGVSWYSDAQISFSEEEAVRKVTEIHEKIADSGFRDFGTGEEDFSDTVIPYDLHVKYTLKSGKTVERYYDRASMNQLADLLQLEDSDEFRQAAAEVIRGDLASVLWNSEAFASGEIYVTDPWLSGIQKLNLGENRRKELLEAIAADVASQGAADRYFPEEDADLRLFFTLNGESDLETFAYSSSNASVWLTDAYQNTTALLASWGVENSAPQTGTENSAVQTETAVSETEDAADIAAAGIQIESVTLQKYDPYASMNRLSDPVSVLFLSYRSDSDDEFPFRQDFGTRPELTDPQQIAEIAPSLRSTYFMSGGGYIAAVKLAGSSKYVYKFLPYEDAPDYINQKMG